MAKIHEIDGWIDRVKEQIIDPQREIIESMISLCGSIICSFTLSIQPSIS